MFTVITVFNLKAVAEMGSCDCCFFRKPQQIPKGL